MWSIYVWVGRILLFYKYWEVARFSVPLYPQKSKQQHELLAFFTSSQTTLQVEELADQPPPIMIKARINVLVVARGMSLFIFVKSYSFRIAAIQVNKDLVDLATAALDEPLFPEISIMEALASTPDTRCTLRGQVMSVSTPYFNISDIKMYK